MKNFFSARELSIDELHQQSRQWLSEVQFIYDEIRFFNKLVDKHFVFMLSKENIDKAREVLALINDVRKKLEVVEKDIRTHEHNLVLLIEKAPVITEEAYYKEHQRLADELFDLEQEFRKLKSELYELGDKALEIEKKETHGLEP